MIHTENKKKLFRFGKRLNTLSSKLIIGTNTLTPINFEEEKIKFFSSNTYNPVYFYSPNDTYGLHKEILSLNEELDNIRLSNSLKYYFRSALQSFSTDIDLIDAIGTDSFADVASDIFKYESFSSSSFLKETANIKFNEPSNCTLHSANEIAKKFQEYIDDLDLEYKVTVDAFNGHIIRVGAHSLVIGEKVRRFCKNIDRLIVHEIESHILQRHNMKNTANPLLRIIPRQTMSLWGEGLAVYNEINSGTITRGTYENYYYRLKAVENINLSFREIFNKLTSYISPEKAFMITYRVKRGMGDTAQPGGFGKDASYLLGYKTVKDYIENGGSIDFLYVSKYPVIGELLNENELLEHSNVLLPAYLKENRSTKNSITNKYNSPSLIT